MPALLHEPEFSLFNTDSHPTSPSLADAIAFALQKYQGFNFLPSNYDSIETHVRNASPATPHFSCDDFRMYEFKVRRCMRGRSHDWTECPFAHPGEKARRRDPRRIHYSGSPCPDFRKGSCRRGDACEFAHGVFECWLHPARYRTQVCKDGKNCKRRVCFFAHSPEQLRILPTSPTSAQTYIESADGSPVGSHRSPSSQHNALEMPSSPPLAVSGGSASRFLKADMAFMVSTSAQSSSLKEFPPTGMVSGNLVSSNAFMPHSSHEVSPVSVHLDSLNAASPLRRAMAQSFLAGKNYGGASGSLISPPSSPSEYTPLFDTYGHMCGSPQQHHGGSNGKARDGRFPELHVPLGSLDNGHSYEFSSYSHGFASPTSTLAGHAFSPPPLSPPLSPLSSPNSTSGQCKGSFTNLGNSLSNCYIDDTAYYRGSSESSMRTYSMDCMEDLAFQLQQLQLPATFESIGFSPQNLHDSRLAMLESMPPKSGISFIGHGSHGLTYTPKQLILRTSLNQFSSKNYAADLLQSKDASGSDNAAKMYGEESLADNLGPDFGWVSELVK